MGAVEFGDLIKQARERRGWKGKDLADRLTIGASTLSEYERGDRKTMPPPEVIEGFSRELFVSQTELVRAWGYLTDSESRPDELTAIHQQLDADLRVIVQDRVLTNRLAQLVADIADIVRDRLTSPSSPAAEAPAPDTPTPAVEIRAIRRTP